jgi:predicted enzyme related to lactoylglutathione lyase
MQKRNPVVHFEMPYNDAARLSKFYGEVFGWGMNNLGAQMNEYVTASTAETDENRMVKTPGTINGGFFPQSSSPEAKTSVVISVDDINEAIKKVTENGGQVVGQPREISGIGIYVGIIDTEGNRLSILQPKTQ